ncbi:MAG: hypothetical protein DWQ02_20775 [Bacteroidetes bacterium]|nr:MAG: hypothetical protein DWQ02_20775 [Bacteroidota bacterium]
MIPELLIKYRWALIAILMAALAWAVYLLPGTRISQNFSTYFPDEDPDLELYHKMIAELGDEDNLLSVVVNKKSTIFDSIFLKKFHQFTHAARELPHVANAHSLTTLNEPRKTPFGVLTDPLIHFENPESYTSDSLRLIRDNRIKGRLFSKDFQSLVVILEFEKELSSNLSEPIISSIEELSMIFGFEIHMMGRKYFEVTYNRISNKELKKSLALCLGLMILMLGFLYRSVWAVVLPVLVFVFSVILFLGFLVWIDHPLDSMTNLAPTILLIVSISDVIHFFSKYESRIKAGDDKQTALTITIQKIGLALILTSFTTAIGFLTLMTSSLPNMRKFGVEIAAGVVITFLVTMILVPFVLHAISKDSIHLRTDWFHWWERRAAAIWRIINSRPQWIIRTVLLLVAISAFGLTRINTNNFFNSSVPKGHTFNQAVDFCEEHLAGVRTFEIALLPKRGLTLNDINVLKEVEKLHTYIDSLPLVNAVVSPVTYYQTLNRSWHGGNENKYVLPENQQEINRLERRFEKSGNSAFQTVVNQKKSFGKISGRMNDIGRQKVYDLNDQVQVWIDENMDKALLDVRIIGASAMADKIQEHAIRNMFTGLGWALLVVSLLIFLLYRDWKIVLVVLAVNVLPLLITGAIMALLGLELKFGTSIIFTIGFVIAVDDTIHFIGRYLRERADQSVEAACKTTILETGRAMLLTSIVLFFGFAQLITSGFQEAKSVGILVSIMLVFALLVDLFVAPLLILRLKDR